MENDAPGLPRASTIEVTRKLNGPCRFGYVIRFVNELGTDELVQIATHALRSWPTTSLLVQQTEESPYVGLIPPISETGDFALLRQLRRLFKPEVPMSGLGSIYPIALGFQLILSLFGEETPSEEVKATQLEQLRGLPGAIAAEHQADKHAPVVYVVTFGYEGAPANTRVLSDCLLKLGISVTIDMC